MLTALHIDAGVTPPHEVRDTERLAALTESMRANGWQGRPVLAVPNGDGWQLLTGSHRYAAALAAGLTEIPAYCIPSDALDADGWDELDRPYWDDDDKLELLQDYGLAEAAELMRAEVDANHTQEDRTVTGTITRYTIRQGDTDGLD